MRFLKVTTAPMRAMANTPAMVGPTKDIVVGPSWCVPVASAAEAAVLIVAACCSGPELESLALSELEPLVLSELDSMRAVCVTDSMD